MWRFLVSVRGGHKAEPQSGGRSHHIRGSERKFSLPSKTRVEIREMSDGEGAYKIEKGSPERKNFETGLTARKERKLG